MTIAQGYKSHNMFHEGLPPRYVTSEAEKAQAEADGYGMTYIHQAYPTTLYKNGKAKEFADAKAEKAAMADGWSKDAPVLDGGTEQ